MAWGNLSLLEMYDPSKDPNLDYGGIGRRFTGAVAEPVAKVGGAVMESGRKSKVDALLQAYNNRKSPTVGDVKGAQADLARAEANLRAAEQPEADAAYEASPAGKLAADSAKKAQEAAEGMEGYSSTQTAYAPNKPSAGPISPNLEGYYPGRQPFAGPASTVAPEGIDRKWGRR